MGVSFQKLRLQFWDAMIEQGQVPPCVPVASESTAIHSTSSTHEPFLLLLLALVLNHTVPLLLPSLPSPPFLPLPLPLGCSLSSPIIFSQQFYQRPSRFAAKAGEAGIQPRCSLAGVPGAGLTASPARRLGRWAGGSSLASAPGC